MRCSDFDYELPPALIAQSPLAVRSESRLLHLPRKPGAPEDLRMHDLPALLRPGDLLVFNNTRVIPARLQGTKTTGGRIEVLVERVLDDQRVLAQVRGGRSLRPGMQIHFDDDVSARVAGRDGEFHELHFTAGNGSPSSRVFGILERIGSMPLPPYIERNADATDRERYQTIFAERDGAVAAPTAGLHFDDGLVARARAAGAVLAGVTLHVGAGTFQPVRSERVREHRMHSEWFEVDAAICERVRATREAGGRVIAVGTTVVRALESAARDGGLEPFAGETDIFITPGYRFRIVDALLTNFHLPRSTLLMLVCAFAGSERVLAAYRHAVAQRYRFFSYGDAMFLSS